MIEAIAGIGTAFGLSGSAGLNAYIPLLIVALAGRFPNERSISQAVIALRSFEQLVGYWSIGHLANY